MRILRLDLIRYGHFTDRGLELPQRPLDLHLVYGPNEAGKSTALSAASEFLFGFEKSTPYNFRHDYSDLRLAASLEADGVCLQAWRRKGNRDTLIHEDGIPLPGGETALRPFLGSVDRAFFERMFSLDHVRLRQGGEEILKEQGDMARTLFAASAGIWNLKGNVDALNAEADKLWGPRRAAHRRFTQVQDRLIAARRLIQERTVTAPQWAELDAKLRDARARLDEATSRIAQGESERRKLARIRRVQRSVRRQSALLGEQESLGAVQRLPPDTLNDLNSARQTLAEAHAAVRNIESDIHEWTEKLNDISFDAALLERKEWILDLAQRRGAMVKARTDLPGLRNEVDRLRLKIQQQAKELRWPDEDIDGAIARSPSRVAVAQARTLITDRTRWEQRLEAAQKESKEASEQLATVTEQRRVLGAIEDVSVLAGQIAAARGTADIDAKVESLDRQIASARKKLERQMSALRPAVVDAETWAQMPVPTTAEVRAHAADLEIKERALQQLQQQISQLQKDVARSKRDRENIEKLESVASEEAVRNARAHRNAGWSLIERKYVRQQSVESDEIERYTRNDSTLPDAYVEAVVQADDLMDRRFDKAEAAGRLSELGRTEQQKYETQRELEADAALVAESIRQSQSNWTALWSPTGIEPLPAAPMARWLETRDAVLVLIHELDGLGSERQSLVEQRMVRRAALLQALASAHVQSETLTGDALMSVLETAAEARKAVDERNAARLRLDRECVRGKVACDARRAAVDTLLSEFREWTANWNSVATALGLRADAVLEVLRAQVETLDQLREDAADAATLKHERIDKIERDLTLYETDVREQVDNLASDLAQQGSDDATNQLRARLRDSEAAKQKYDATRAHVERLHGRKAQTDEMKIEAEARIVGLLELARVESVEALEAAIARSERAQRLDADITQVRAELAQQGDGLSEQDLASECEGVDLDQAAAREKELESALEALRKQQVDDRDALKGAQIEFAAVGGGEDLNAAQSAFNSAVAEMRTVAEEYVRVSVAGRLLNWALERYRREQQGPLLKRAGALFQNITGGSFARLEVAYDDQDEAQLVGVRGNDERVKVTRLSEGTRDQLYLALRVAALDHYLDSAPALPFVADDLFVNFDDDRARAGLKVLADLSRRTQVLFFTHHKHIVDLAKEVVGEELSVVNL